jgi:peptide/nickel transport system substrate-binding protein
MRRRSRLLPGLALLALLAGCGGGKNDGPVAVSIIGSTPSILDPDRKPLAGPSAVLLAATAQGLVRFDGTGQIEPGLAIRWDVSDDGLYYTFRLASGLGLDAEDVARRLRAAIGGSSHNPLKPLFGAVDEIVAVTPEVVEIRLVAPQPYLLELLAQPEMTLLDGGAGTGPFTIGIREPTALVLNPVAPPDDEPPATDEQSDNIRLRGERAALAVARFKEGKADLVLGGSFANLSIARIAKPPARQLRLDPAAGLFGLAIVNSSGFLASVENRRALALAIDRARIAAAFPDSGWRPSETLVAPGTTELGAAIPPDWAGLAPTIRAQIAAGSVRLWAQRNGRQPKLRVAMPDGPGARLLFTLLAIGWREIGVEAIRVGPEASADLRLIDAVAPSDTASWYLHSFSCAFNAVCSPAADAALDAAEKATTAAERARLLAEADAALAEAIPFLPIAQPVRWSLTSQRLDGFQENPRAIHPLNHLLRAKR